MTICVFVGEMSVSVKDFVEISIGEMRSLKCLSKIGRSAENFISIIRRQTSYCGTYKFG